jgi:LDH2 family malate/lactate/ureidoglycolate dehydrogenase
MTARLDPDALCAFGAAVLQAAGVPEPDARLVAESLVTAVYIRALRQQRGDSAERKT